MPYKVVLDAPDQARHRIQIATLGDFTDKRYGEFSITREDVESWQQNLAQLPGGKALIDLDHRADRSPRNTEAAGWITGVGWEGETPVAEVEWTPVGEQAIKDRRYLFFSPTYGPLTTEDGQEIENVLQGGALTNKPFLTSMPALTLASEETLQEAADRFEQDNAERLLDALSSKQRNNLPDSAFALPGRRYPIHDKSHARNALARCSGKPEESKVKAAVYKKYPDLKSDSDGDGDGDGDDGGTGTKSMGAPEPGAKTLDSPDATMDEQVFKALGFDKNAPVDALLAAIKELQAAADVPVRTLEQRALDNGKVLLDRGDHQKLVEDAAKYHRARKELDAQMFDVAFTRAVENGRATDSQRDHFETFYKLDANHTLRMLNDGPKVVNTRPSGWNNGSLELDDAPAGIEASSHVTAQKVRSRLRQLGKNVDEFHVVLEQMMAEGEI